jgi:hypothetical protein
VILPRNRRKSLAFDPSYVDVETIEFHLKINGVDLFVAGGKYDNHAITLEKYEAGDVHEVEVYLRDKDGAESPHYTFKAAVFPSYPMVQHPYIGLPAFDPDAPSTGEFNATPTGQLTAPGMGYGPYSKAVYGTFLPDGATDDGYQRFSEWPAVIVKQQDGLDANFVFDQASKDFAAANGADIVYRFSIDVRTAEGAPSGGAPLPGNKYVENTTGHLVVDLVGNDRVIIATVIPEMRVNGAVFRTAGPHQIIVHTPVSENVSTWDQIYDLYKIVRDLAPQFGQAVVDLFATMASGGFESIVANLQTGIAGAGEQFIQDFKTTAKQAFFQWLGGTSTIANIANYNFANLDDIKSFLLQYAGLTWDNVQSILVQELGAGNVAAIGQVHALFAANNIDVSDPKSLITFLQQADLGDIAGQLVDKALGKIEEEVKRAVPLFFATFIPGAGTARALYKGLNWLLQNRTELGEVFTRIVDSLGALSSGTVLVKNLVQAFSLRFPDETAAGARQGMSDFGPRLVDRRLQKRVDLQAGAVLRRDPIDRKACEPPALSIGFTPRSGDSAVSTRQAACGS